MSQSEAVRHLKLQKEEKIYIPKVNREFNGKKYANVCYMPSDECAEKQFDHFWKNAAYEYVVKVYTKNSNYIVPELKWKKDISHDEFINERTWLKNVIKKYKGKSFNKVDDLEEDINTSRQEAILLQHCIITAPLCRSGPLILFRAQYSCEPLFNKEGDIVNHKVWKKPYDRLISTSSMAKGADKFGPYLFVYRLRPGTPFLCVPSLRSNEYEVLLPAGLMFELIPNNYDDPRFRKTITLDTYSPIKRIQKISRAVNPLYNEYSVH